MNREYLMKARTLLMNVTPMARDCGRSCGAACCQPDEDGQGGVYLFPGEEELLGEIAWGKVAEDSAVLDGKRARMLVCEGMCEREKRPLGCMIFPLTPRLGEDGRVDVGFDLRARTMCPLLRYGMTGLRRDFVSAVREALGWIARDEEGLRFLRDWEALEQQYDMKL